MDRFLSGGKPVPSLLKIQRSQRRSEELAEVGARCGGLHIKPTLAGDFEGGARGERAKGSFSGEFGLELTADDRHSFWGIRAEVELTGSDDSDCGPATVALVANTLHGAFKI